MENIINHNIKFGEDNAIILTKTQAVLPLFKVFNEDFNEDRKVAKIDNYTNIVIKGKGLNKDSKSLLSMILKKCFNVNNANISFTEDDFLNYKGVDSTNKWKYRGLVKEALEDILSTRFSYTAVGFEYNCNFFDNYIEDLKEKGSFNVTLSSSYIQMILRDKFHIKYPVEISNSIKGDTADIIYSFLKSNDYFKLNTIQMAKIRTSCFSQSDLEKNNLKKTNEKIVKAIAQLEKLNLITDVQVVYKQGKRKIIDDYRYTIVSQYKNIKEISNADVIEEETKQPATAPQVEVEVENFADHEPVPEKKEVNATTEIPFDLFDDDLPF